MRSNIPPDKGCLHPNHIKKTIGTAWIKCPSPLQSPPRVSPSVNSNRTARVNPGKTRATIFNVLMFFITYPF
jgi:hypothetical protein